jgi:hypothetical protein
MRTHAYNARFVIFIYFSKHLTALDAVLMQQCKISEPEIIIITFKICYGNIMLEIVNCIRFVYSILHTQRFEWRAIAQAVCLRFPTAAFPGFILGQVLRDLW